MKVIRHLDLIRSGIKLVYEDNKTPTFRKSSAPPVPVNDSPSEAPKQLGKLELGSHVHKEHFHNPSTKFSKITPIHGSANGVFHAKTADDQQYIVKPHSDAGVGHEPERWDSRNNVANRLLDRMGSSHMGVHGFTGDFPDANDGVTGSYAGTPAHVTSFNKNVIPAHHASSDQLDNISGEHRLTGLVHHILMSNPDGHHGNVLIDPARNHPVHIDHDVALSSSASRYHSQPNERNPEGKRAVMSVYNPGEDLDYTKGSVTDPVTGQSRPIGRVGTNFPPHIMQTLHDTAAGKMSHGLSPEDHTELVGNAKDLIHHGLEGTMARRYLSPTYKKRDELGWKNDE